MTPPAAAEVPYGTLDLMILKTLDALGAQHGYGIARRIEQVAAGMVARARSIRLEQKGWIEGDRGVSDNNRRARFYRMTRAGRRHLTAEERLWRQTVELMTRLLEAES